MHIHISRGVIIANDKSVGFRFPISWSADVAVVSGNVGVGAADVGIAAADVGHDRVVEVAEMMQISTWREHLGTDGETASNVS